MIRCIDLSDKCTEPKKTLCSEHSDSCKCYVTRFQLNSFKNVIFSKQTFCAAGKICCENRQLFWLSVQCGQFVKINIENILNFVKLLFSNQKICERFVTNGAFSVKYLIKLNLKWSNRHIPSNKFSNTFVSLEIDIAKNSTPNCGPDLRLRLAAPICGPDS